jgi:hypothetical protein
VWPIAMFVGSTLPFAPMPGSSLSDEHGLMNTV